VNPDCGLKTRNWNEVKSVLRNMIQEVQNIRAEIEWRKHNTKTEADNA